LLLTAAYLDPDPRVSGMDRKELRPMDVCVQVFTKIPFKYWLFTCIVWLAYEFWLVGVEQTTKEMRTIGCGWF